MLTRADIENAADLVHRVVPPTPTHHWPLLGQRTGAEIWVKHENHTPIGAFKVRGGLTYMDALKREQPSITGVITATRGNHGQSVAFAARRSGLAAYRRAARRRRRKCRHALERANRARARFPGGLRICHGSGCGSQASCVAILPSLAGAWRFNLWL
jgi:hypothetical protein